MNGTGSILTSCILYSGLQAAKNFSSWKGNVGLNPFGGTKQKCVFNNNKRK